MISTRSDETPARAREHWEENFCSTAKRQNLVLKSVGVRLSPKKASVSVRQMTTRGIRRKKSYLVDAKIAVCGQKSVGKSGKIPPTYMHAHDDDAKFDTICMEIFQLSCRRSACYRIIVMFNISSKQKMQMQKWKIFKWKANKSAFHNGFHVESLPVHSTILSHVVDAVSQWKRIKKKFKRRMRFENVKNSLKRTGGEDERWEKMSVNMRKKIYELKKKSSFVSQVLSLIRRWEPRALTLNYFSFPHFSCSERDENLFALAWRWCCCCFVLFSSEITHVCLALLDDVWWWENICAQKVIKFTRATRAAFIISRDLVLCKFIIIQPVSPPLIA